SGEDRAWSSRGRAAAHSRRARSRDREGILHPPDSRDPLVARGEGARGTALRGAREGRERALRAAQVEEDLLQVAAPRSEPLGPARQLLILRPPPRRKLQRRAPDPSVHREGLEAAEAKEQRALGDLRPHAGQLA